MFYSEQINAAPNVVESSTYTANAYTSPDGTQNAAQFTETTANDRHGFYQYATISSQAYTASVFTKQTGRRYIAFTTDATGSQRSSFFDLQTKSVLTSGTGHTCSVQDYGNGWLRLIVSLNASSGSRYFIWGGSIDGIGIGYVGSTSLSQTFWGNQLEAGAYATSYVKTEAAAVTRLREAVQKTSISSLIGQTEGVLFAEFSFNGAANSGIYEVIISVNDGTSNNRIDLIKNNTTAELYVFVINGGVIQVNSAGIAGTNISGRHKVALAYKLNDYVCYFDGVAVHTDTTATVPAVGILDIGVDNTNTITGTISQALLFKTRLTNAQLAELTTL
jgi:hypothetical protein